MGDDPATDLVARENPREQPVVERVQQRPLEVQRVPTAHDRAHFAAVFLPERRHPGHGAHGALDGDGAQPLLAGEQGRGEVATDLLRQDAQMDRCANSVETSRRPRDTRDARLELTHPHVVADVPGLAVVGVPLGPRHTHIVSGSDTDRGIGEARDQRLQRSLLRTSRRVGGDDDVASQQRHGRVLCGRLPCPPRQPQQLDTAARVLTHDRVGLVGRGVRHHEDLPPIRGVFEPQQVVECLADHGFFVVDREHDTDRRPLGRQRGGGSAPPEESGQPQQQGIAHVGIGGKCQRDDEQPNTDCGHPTLR